MALNVNDVIEGLDTQRRRGVEERAAELIAEEMTLRELRKARRLTQVSLARELGIGQEGISRMAQERRGHGRQAFAGREVPRPTARRVVRYRRSGIETPLPSLAVAVDGIGGEGGQADGDVLGSFRARRAVADPFARVRDDRLTRRHVHDTALVFNAQ